MTIEAKRIVVTRYIDAYNRFDVDGMMDLIHPEIHFENVSDGVVTARATGADEFRMLAEQGVALFASRTQTVQNFEESDDRISIEVNFEGQLASDLPNGMRAGDALRLRGRSDFEFRDGKIYRLIDRS